MTVNNSISYDYRVAESVDDRGLPFYVIKHDGRDVTTRWTRADADHELLRLIADEFQQFQVAHRSSIATM